jgi:hypothetical protein
MVLNIMVTVEGVAVKTNVDKEENKDKRKPVRVIWSRDSKKFAMTRSDSRKVKDLWVINSIANPRPTLETYKYQMPGDSEAPQMELIIFDLATKEKLKVNAERKVILKMEGDGDKVGRPAQF